MHMPWSTWRHIIWLNINGVLCCATAIGSWFSLNPSSRYTCMRYICVHILMSRTVLCDYVDCSFRIRPQNAKGDSKDWSCISLLWLFCIHLTCSCVFEDVDLKFQRGLANWVVTELELDICFTNKNQLSNWLVHCTCVMAEATTNYKFWCKSGKRAKASGAAAQCTRPSRRERSIHPMVHVCGWPRTSSSRSMIQSA